MPAPPRFVGLKPSQSFQRRGCNGDAREARVQTEDDARVTPLPPDAPLRRGEAISASYDSQVLQICLKNLREG